MGRQRRADRTREPKARSRGGVVAASFDRTALAELDTYIADRQAESGDLRFRRATAVRELVLLALGLAERVPNGRASRRR